MMSPFSNREIVIVTMHQKEKIIGPILREQTGMIPLVSQGVNTDAFGMFSGERSRTGTPGEAALGKIDAAVKTHPQYSLFLASEGSFFPSPHIPFFTLNEELLLLKDLENKWSVMATYQTHELRLVDEEIKNASELIDKSLRAGFPENGIILRVTNKYDQVVEVKKDALTMEELIRQYLEVSDNYSGFRCNVVSDLRAHRHMERRESIRRATMQLLQNLNACCPECRTPGFVVNSVERGLPCSSCAAPTRGIKTLVKKCMHCGYSSKEHSGETFMDPMYCDFCNP
jgi:hypothetical protein